MLKALPPDQAAESPASKGGVAATEGDLTTEEIQIATRAAKKSVEEAMRQEGGISQSTRRQLPESCDLVVKGFPLVGAKRQQCCKVDPTNQFLKRTIIIEAELPKAGGVAATTGEGRLGRGTLQGLTREGSHESLEQGSEYKEAGGNGGKRSLRHLVGDDFNDIGGRMMGAGESAVGSAEGLRTPRSGRNESESEEVVCLPSFVIAGTQKSGTTALAGWFVGWR